MPPDHVKVALDFHHGPVMDHLCRQLAHAPEIGGHCRQSVEYDFIGRGFVIRDYAYLAAHFEVEFPRPAHQFYQLRIELAVQDEIHLVFPDDFRRDR